MPIFVINYVLNPSGSGDLLFKNAATNHEFHHVPGVSQQLKDHIYSFWEEAYEYKNMYAHINSVSPYKILVARLP